jgi:hypothetical protein
MAMVRQQRLVEVESVESPAAERPRVGVEKSFRPYNPDRVLLVAPSLRDWVPDGDLAHFKKSAGCRQPRGAPRSRQRAHRWLS